jgi:uncharacterized protein YlxP (DUF503 family)
MPVSTLTVDLRLEAVATLRQKRRLMRGIVAKLRRHFNVSVAEVGAVDEPSEARLTIAAAGRTRAEVHDLIRHAAAALEAHPIAEIARRHVEDVS